MAAVSPLASPQDVAFAGLYERHAGRVFAYCLRWLRSREEAEEAAQTTFFHAWRSLERGVEPRSETAWLLTIARNVCRNASSSVRRRTEVVHDPHILEDTLEAREAPPELEGLAQALASLTEQQRRALLMREWQGLSYSEIAAELGLSQSAVETLLFRARRSLAARLRRPLSIGSLLPWLKSILGGAAAVVAVTATGIAVSQHRHHPAPPAPAAPAAPAPAHQAVTPVESPAPAPAPMRVTHKQAFTRHVPAAAPRSAPVAPPTPVPTTPAQETPVPPAKTETTTATPPAAAASPAPPVAKTVQDTAQTVVDTATKTAGDVVNTVTTAVAPVIDTATQALPTVPAVTTPTLPLP